MTTDALLEPLYRWLRSAARWLLTSSTMDGWLDLYERLHMAEGLLLVAMLALGLAIGAALVVACYATELGRQARFLSRRERLSNARLTCGSRLPGTVGMVDAVNAEIDAADARLAAMSGLLDELFSYARATDPDTPLDLGPVALRPMLEQVLLGHYPEFEKRGWEPAMTCGDVMVDADAEALARIVENLVANALRHGCGPLSVSARAEEAPGGEGGGVAVDFSNPVPDPSAIDADRLFERFYQADASRATAGSGLGLSVAAKLAEAQGMGLSARLDGDVLTITLAMAGGRIPPSPL